MGKILFDHPVLLEMSVKWHSFSSSACYCLQELRIIMYLKYQSLHRSRMWHKNGIAHSFLNIIQWYAPRVVGNNSSRLTQIYSLSYISLSKRGQITDSKLEKVIETVKDEIGINLSITSDQVKSVYKAIGSFITPDNAANAFNIMSRGIAGNSLRLQLILVQSAGSGLTSYIHGEE